MGKLMNNLRDFLNAMYGPTSYNIRYNGLEYMFMIVAYPQVDKLIEELDGFYSEIVVEDIKPILIVDNGKFELELTRVDGEYYYD